MTSGSVSQLVTAMRRAGFGEELIAPMVRVPPGTRRRATFAFLRRRKELLFGFHARASHNLVDIGNALCWRRHCWRWCRPCGACWPTSSRTAATAM